MNKETASPTGSARSVTSVVPTPLTAPPPAAPAAPVVASTTPTIVSITKPPAAATVTGTTSAGQVEVCTEQTPSKHPTQQLTIATALLPTTVTPTTVTSTTITPTTAAVVVVSTPTILSLARPPATPSTASASPPTQQQFTVHGQFVGLHNHTGPAPNVTVNPHYQPPQPPDRPASPATRVLIPVQPPPAADQQIRVLTPSEIMRTLPSLCQDTYDLPVSQPSMVSSNSSLLLVVRLFHFFFVSVHLLPRVLDRYIFTFYAVCNFSHFLNQILTARPTLQQRKTVNLIKKQNIENIEKLSEKVFDRHHLALVKKILFVCI